jgi:cysteine sulfinate desulfinase/cysteine desulfurase-like protein
LIAIGNSDDNIEVSVTTSGTDANVEVILGAVISKISADGVVNFVTTALEHNSIGYLADVVLP